MGMLQTPPTTDQLQLGNPCAHYMQILPTTGWLSTQSISSFAHTHTHTQAGYRSHLSTVHQAFVLQHVIDEQKHAHEPLYLCFVDLKAAYDKVQWPLIRQVLQRLGIHGSMLTAIQSLYTACSLAMKINGFHGDMHSPSVGLRQGCPLSATLFGLFLDGLHHHPQVSVPDAGIKI